MTTYSTRNTIVTIDGAPLPSSDPEPICFGSVPLALSPRLSLMLTLLMRP